MATRTGSEKNAIAALGIRAHSGWAVIVAVGGSRQKPIVLERRRIEIADTSIPGSKQPFHTAKAFGMERAEELIGRCRASSLALATQAVRSLVGEPGQKGLRVAGSGIVFGAARPLPELESILRSHALIHTAEGEFFREVLVRASEDCLLPVTRVKEREIYDSGAAAMGIALVDLERLLLETGRALGPPWRQDEKLASLAGWIALWETGWS